jgi:glycine cleavage system H lipoate-binding protein
MEKGGSGQSIDLVPVDADGDNVIGGFEDIYASASSLSHAIYVGRFPRALYTKIYALTYKGPVSDGERAFLEWLLGGGQETLAMAGMLELSYAERNSRMAQLRDHEQVLARVPAKVSPARIFLLAAGLLILLGLAFSVLAWIAGRSKEAPAVSTSMKQGIREFPGGLFFDRSHTWAYMEKNGRVRVGIDAFLQQVAGPVTRIVTKQAGEEIKRGEHFLTLIQNGKRLEIKSPVSGMVQAQNEELLVDAGSLNRGPYTDGWILMVEPKNWIKELRTYFMGQSYVEWIKQEGARLKAFFASAMKPEDMCCPEPVLQDGGEIRSGLMEDFGPEFWEEFQDRFLDSTP